MFNCLRRSDELSFAGGVFVTVEAPNERTGKMLAKLGMPTASDGRYMLIHNPMHLLGIEAILSVRAC
jgi:predicted homoserine dehydrogenase-like protein